MKKVLMWSGAVAILLVLPLVSKAQTLNDPNVGTITPAPPAATEAPTPPPPEPTLAPPAQTGSNSSRLNTGSENTTTGVGDVFTLVQKLIAIINGALVPLIFALAFIVFVWGVFQYFVFGGANEEAKEKGKSLMLYGLIGFFVMASVWGIVNLLVNTLELDTGRNINVPQVPEL